MDDIRAKQMRKLSMQSESKEVLDKERAAGSWGLSRQVRGG